MRIDVIAQKQARQLSVFFEICKHQGHALLYALPVIGIGLAQPVRNLIQEPPGYVLQQVILTAVMVVKGGPVDSRFLT